MEHKQFSAGGIVIKKSNEIKVLLIKDRFGQWTWPKGHIEKGESSETAALREIFEETGLQNISVKEKIDVHGYYFYSGEEKIYKTVDIFLVETFGNENIKVQEEEISLAEWFSPEDALQKIDYEGSRNILEKAIRIFEGKV